jgi:2',3'-cyclic-nucleotide 2'-phosphodiesterase (5'-nucleotidase family)
MLQVLLNSSLEKIFFMKYYACVIALFFLNCFSLMAQSPKDTICILQLNDVYEIGALNQGKEGGMARVATLVKQQEARYQTFVVVAGDFVSPSVIGTTKIDSQRVNGRHMIDLMNKVGVDLVVFGNHEFDIPERDLQQRINESQFTWLSSDVQHKNSNGSITPFYRTKPDSQALPVSYLLPSAHGQFTIGIVNATIQVNKQPWVVYNDKLQSIRQACTQVKKQSDIVVGLTHLSVAEDKTLLQKIKQLRLIMGGHEHQHSYTTVRKGAIAKADANAKTMYRHLIFRNGKRGKMKIISELINIDSTVVPDPATAIVVKAWEDKAYIAFRAIGLEPVAEVYHTREPLDGTELNGRYRQTNLGILIAQSMMAVSPKAKAAIFNSGSIRIDDMISGVMTQLDVIRTLPFGGRLCEVTLTGALLTQLLTTGEQIKGLGGYLQRSPNLRLDGNNWLLNDTSLVPSKTYTIVTPEFLITGAEQNLEFFKERNPDIKQVVRFKDPTDIRADIRLVVVKYLSEKDGK